MTITIKYIQVYGKTTQIHRKLFRPVKLLHFTVDLKKPEFLIVLQLNFIVGIFEISPG